MNKQSITLSLIILAIFFLALRTIGIGDLESFTDEASNILCSIDEETNKLIDPMAYGRPLLSYQFKLASLDTNYALEISRILVGVVGLLGALVFFFLVKKIFSPKIAIACFLVWTVSTYHVAHERLALQDPFSTLFLLLMTYLLLKASDYAQSKKQFWKVSVLVAMAGIFFALSILNKISGVSGIVWPLGLLLIYIYKNKFTINKSQLVTFGLVFLFSTALFILVQPGILTIGSTMIETVFISKQASIFTLVQNFLQNLITSSDFYYKWAKGYGGQLFTILFIYFLISTPFQNNKTQKALWTLFLLYVCINTAMYGDYIFSRYIHHETVIIILFLVYGVSSRLKVNATKLPLKIEKIFLMLALIFAISENLLGNFSIITDNHKTWLAQKSWDYRQYTDRAWSGNGLKKLDQSIEQILTRDPKAMFITTIKFRIDKYGLKLKYFQTAMATKFVHLDFSSELLAAPGLLYYQKRYPQNNFYLVIAANKTISDARSIDFLTTNLQAPVRQAASVSRNNYYNDAFIIFEIGPSYYQAQVHDAFNLNDPNRAGPVLKLSPTDLKQCPLNQILMSSVTKDQRVQAHLKNQEIKTLNIKKSWTKLKDFEIQETDLPVIFIASDWLLEDIISGYDQQRIRALEFACGSL